MPEIIPKLRLDLEDLAFHQGVPVLLRRSLARMAEGELLEVHGDSSDLELHIRSWCRQSGNPYHGGGNGVGIYIIERGAVAVPLLSSGPEVAEVAEPTWALAPRGAMLEAGGPSLSFPLSRKKDVWAQELNSIHRQAVANQWSAAKDIPWQQLPKLSSEVEGAVCQIMTFLTENEFAALYIPARFLARIHPHYREVVQVLAMQIADEARHAEAFIKRAEAGGQGLGTTAASGQLSLKSLMEEADFTSAVFLLCVMGEGTFLTLLPFLERHAPDAVTAMLARLAHRDEARHVAFGVEHIRYILGLEPERRSSLAAAVERRNNVLASVTGLSPYVHDALVIYSGGGIEPSQIRHGASCVAELHRDMDRSRRERLQSLGFGAQDAETLSAYHTKNFM
ncbi:MAG: ferritin-like domain-containing protein [Acidobacteria bacterium]|nr:ferritin-like domain-containing protein [Acidobacteriota bacterium]